MRTKSDFNLYILNEYDLIESHACKGITLLEDSLLKGNLTCLLMQI